MLQSGSGFAAQTCVQHGSGVGGTGAPQGGIGGTGAPVAGGTGGTGAQPDSGVGGTGAVAGGIGGTGLQADSGVGGTGIVGTITGFASVCIGELEVHFGADTPVSMNGQPSSATRLAIGQVVAMEAGPTAKGLTARSIAILHALEGPVTRADLAHGVLEVMGQPVRLAAGVNASRIAAGNPVRVSGLRDARGIVHATRVEPAPGLTEASAIGFLRRGGTIGSLDGLEVAGAGAGSGIELMVRGKWDGRRLQVRERRADPSLPFVGRVREVVVEGLVHGRSDQVLKISGFEVRLGSEVRLSGNGVAGLAEGSRIRVVGRIEPGRRIIAVKVDIERERGTGGDRSGGRGRGGGDGSADDVRTSSGRDRDTEDRRGDGGSGKESSDRGSGDRRDGSADRVSGSGDRSSGSGDRGGSGSRDRDNRSERTEKSDKVDRGERAERLERTDRVDRPEKLERSERIDRVDRGAKTERSGDKPERSPRPESGRGGRN